MTPQYILRKSLCRAPHSFHAHVVGEGYTIIGKLVPNVLQYILDRTRLSEETPLTILADKLDDVGDYYVANCLRQEIERIADYNRQRIKTATSMIDNLNYAHDYAEPGYSSPKKGILFADWNIFPRGVDTILEKYGYEVQWYDEWATCGECNRAVRTQPDSWGWTPYYDRETIKHGELVCLDCSPEETPEDISELGDTGLPISEDTGLPISEETSNVE